MNAWTEEVNAERKRGSAPVVFRWPDEAADLSERPLVYVTVTTPRDQADLHRQLARLGYTPDLIASDEHCDYWRFQHPDGTLPCPT